MKTARLNLSVLKAVSMASGDHDGRRCLEGVYIEVEPEHVTYVATNGHVLLADRQTVDGGNELTGKWIIPSDKIKALKFNKKFPYGVLSAEPQENGIDKLTIAIPWDVEVTFLPVDGVFPDWRRVVPKKYDGKPATYNPTYLALLQKALQNGSKNAVPEIAYNGDGPGLMRYGDTMLGVVMPVRSDEAKLPEWFA